MSSAERYMGESYCALLSYSLVLLFLTRTPVNCHAPTNDRASTEEAEVHVVSFSHHLCMPSYVGFAALIGPQGPKLSTLAIWCDLAGDRTSSIILRHLEAVLNATAA